jgi:guanylate kinase
MSNTPPRLSLEELKAAGRKAVLARTERANFKKLLRDGERDIFDAIADPRNSIARLKVSEVLEAIPGVGATKVKAIMARADISPSRRIGGLGSKQTLALRNEKILNREGSKELKQGTLIVMSGPGGVGKSTITQELRKDSHIWVSISATTREPRPGERDGIDYYFLSDVDFDKMITNGEFLEWAQFAGARYGTPKNPVKEALELGKHVLLEIEIAGARQIRKVDPNAMLVFIAPPSWDELVSRLTARGTDSPERRAARLALAEEEMAAASEFDEVIVNTEVHEVAAVLLSLATSRQL